MPEPSQAGQGLIRILRWICELGRLDFLMPVLLMPRYLAQASEVHLEQLRHMPARLKNFGEPKLMLGGARPSFQKSEFAKCEWKKLYPGASGRRLRWPCRLQGGKEAARWRGHGC